MKIILAEHMGMCFGVRDAIALAHKVANPLDTTIHGELVHNKTVNDSLSARGFAMNSEAGRDAVLPGTGQVMITAHGASDREKQRLAEAGKVLIDTTCPLVRRVHKAAQRLQCEGRLVVVLGRHGHVEVQGIVGDLEQSVVVQDVGDVRAWEAEKIGVICQSTTPPFLAEQLMAEIRRINPGKDVLMVSTICQPTRDRQDAAEKLIGEVEALVVVGGKSSNNTRQLGQLAGQRGLPWRHVEGPGDLDVDWVRGFNCIGLTAGTSTPDETIHAVHRALQAMAA